MIGTSETAVSVETKAPQKNMVQLRKIMVATDFSSASDRALEYALSLARRYGSQVYLTHIVSTDPFAMMAPELAMRSLEKLRQNASQEFGEVMKSERLQNVRYALAIEEGPFWPTMESLIKRFKIDLIVAGTRGMGGVRKFVLGSTAEQIFRQARIPVLIVGPAVEGEPFYEAEFNNILFATDFGVGAGREAAYARSLAEEHGTRLNLLHVIPLPEDHSETALKQAKETALRQMKELAPAETNNLFMPRYWVAIGDPAEEILRMALATRAGLIVMGAKGLKGFADRLPHTKAYKVVCESMCPVLTIRS
jgi:nucleotide-binding universal stress UspA family protein